MFDPSIWSLSLDESDWDEPYEDDPPVVNDSLAVPLDVAFEAELMRQFIDKIVLAVN